MRFILLSVILMLSACASTPAPTFVPFSVSTQLTIGQQVNPYGDVAYHPIVLRFYQLREPGIYNNADFLDIYLEDRKVLGASLIDAQYLEPMLFGQHQLQLDIQRETRYLAVFAEFADYKSAEGKALIRLDDNPDKQVISVQVNGLSVDISMQAKPQKSWWQL